MTRADPAEWLDQLRGWAQASDHEPEAIVAALGAHWCGAAGMDADALAVGRLHRQTGSLALPERFAEPGSWGEDLHDADVLGMAHEALAHPADRRRRGAHYTPREVAERLVAVAVEGLDGAAPDSLVALDPAVGGGAFLLAAGRALVAGGADLRGVARCLVGVDQDPVAVAVSQAAVNLWCGDSPAVTVGDGLSGRLPGPVDLVVGNPPFLSELRAGTAASPDRREELRARFGAARAAYTDAAALFLLAGLDAVRPGGRVALLLPRSVVATRDAAEVREVVAERAALRDMWFLPEDTFAADVQVVAVVAERGGSFPATRVRTGGDAGEVATVAVDADWSALVARAQGVPPVEIAGDDTVGGEATTTAGFRRHFYGLADHVREGGDGPRLVTSGLIEPARCDWGRRTARFAGQRWTEPTVDRSSLRHDDETLDDWIGSRLVPKLVVAQQTKVVEAAIDEKGRWIPSTPVISVEPHDPARLWLLAAVLLAPPVTAWAAQRVAGAGLAPRALRLSATLLADVPLPSRDGYWREAADRLQIEATSGRVEVSWRALGASMCAAYDVDPAVGEWWIERGFARGVDGATVM